MAACLLDRDLHRSSGGEIAVRLCGGPTSFTFGERSARYMEAPPTTAIFVEFRPLCKHPPVQVQGQVGGVDGLAAAL